MAVLYEAKQVLSYNDTLVNRFMGKVYISNECDSNAGDSNPGCWEWLGCRDQGGYGQIKLFGRMHMAHRISYELFVGKIPAKIKCSANGKMSPCCVLHNCNNRACVNPKHLRLGTHTENMQDKYGADPNKPHSACKLTWAQIDKLRYMYETGDFTQQKLADIFNVSAYNVYSWVRGKYKSMERSVVRTKRSEVRTKRSVVRMEIS